MVENPRQYPKRTRVPLFEYVTHYICIVLLCETKQKSNYGNGFMRLSCMRVVIYLFNEQSYSVLKPLTVGFVTVATIISEVGPTSNLV